MVHDYINPSQSNERSPTASATGLNETRAVLPTALLHQRHRAWGLGLPALCEVPASSFPLVIAVGGGKGGVGKSLIAANLAARLARTGFRVAALDLDCGGSNLHTYFGLTGVTHGLGDYVVHGRCSMRELLSPTPVDGLWIAASQRDDAWSVADALGGAGLSRLWAGIQEIGSGRDQNSVDIVLIDLGAGSARHTIDLFCCAHVGVVTALPEPTSVENSYLFMRTTLLRLIENAGRRLGVPGPCAEILSTLAGDAANTGSVRSYTDKLRLLYQANPAIVGPIASVLSGRLLGMLVNQTRSQADIDIGKAMEMAAQRYFGFTAQYLGYLNYDEAAWKSLRNKRLLLTDFPQALLSRRLSEACNALLKGVGVQVG